jgi:hypothetical protein
MNKEELTDYIMEQIGNTPISKVNLLKISVEIKKASS